MSEQRAICREHHWPKDEPSPYHRCLICSIKEEYLDRTMALLNSWSEEEKAAERTRWESMIENCKCKPHIHTPIGYELVSES
jgi:hypothetical protein